MGTRTPKTWKTPAAFSRGRRIGHSLSRGSLFPSCADPRKFLVEFGHLATGVHQPLDAGPGRMRLWINVQPQSVAWLTPAGPGGELCPIRHDDCDVVVFRVDA